MATTKIERATIERVFWEGKGMKLVEWVKVKGNDIPYRYTAWFNQPHGKAEGDIVGVVGTQTHKAGQFQDKDTGDMVHVAEVSLNDTQLIEPKQPEVVAVQSTLDVMENAPF